MPAVSILLPCFNAADTLPECLESLAAQTFRDFEIVAVDDGSTDATGEILEAHSREDARLQMIRQDHGGIVSALQAGLAACRADRVARMDADDRAYPGRLAQQAAFLDAHPEIDVVSCLVRAFPEGEVRGGFRVYLEWLNGLVTHDQIIREIFVESPLPHPSVMFRRAAVLEAGGYLDPGWAEDYDLWLRMAGMGCRFGKVSEVLLDWRERPDRLTRTDGRYSLENFLRAKAHYLVRGPLKGRDAIIVWGAGMMGRRLSKHLLRGGAPLAGFLDVDPKKIGRTRRGLPVWAASELPRLWRAHRNPAVVAAVGARGARRLIREQLVAAGLQEGSDWWSAA